MAKAAKIEVWSFCAFYEVHHSFNLPPIFQLVMTDHTLTAEVNVSVKKGHALHLKLRSGAFGAQT